MKTYIVRIDQDEPLTFSNQADACGAANDAIIAAEQGSIVTAIEKLVDLGVHGQASLTDGRLVSISVEAN